MPAWDERRTTPDAEFRAMLDVFRQAGVSMKDERVSSDSAFVTHHGLSGDVFSLEWVKPKAGPLARLPWCASLVVPHGFLQPARGGEALSHACRVAVYLEADPSGGAPTYDVMLFNVVERGCSVIRDVAMLLAPTCPLREESALGYGRNLARHAVSRETAYRVLEILARHFVGHEPPRANAATMPRPRPPPKFLSGAAQKAYERAA